MYREDSTGAITRAATDTAATTFTDSGLAPGAVYTYFVVSKDASDDSSYPTTEVSAQTAPITIQPIATQTMTEGNSVTVSGSFYDAGPLTTHTGQMNWGDTSSTPATIVESNNAGTASGTHEYTMAGNYFGSVVVSNPAGASTSGPFEVIVGDAPLGRHRCRRQRDREQPLQRAGGRLHRR